MIQIDDARIALRLDSKEAEAELERIRAALEGLDVQSEKEEVEKKTEEKKEKETTYTLGGVLRNAYDVVVSVLETAEMISPMVRGYVREELYNLLRSTGLPPEIAAGLNLLAQTAVQPKLKEIEDKVIRFEAIIKSVVPAAGDTLEVWKAAALFGEGLGPADLIETFGLFMDLHRSQNLVRGDTARRTYERYGEAFAKFAEKVGEEYSNDRLQQALADMLEQSFYQ